MADLIRVKRGLEANLPPLSVGELGYCTDTKNLYIGGENANDLVSSSSPWTAGKTMFIFGDSISTNESYLGGFNWPKFIDRLQLGNVSNMSVSGKMMSGANGVWNAIQNSSGNCDITVTFAGTNDWINNVVPGNWSATSTDTFCGAFKAYISALHSKYPLAEHYFVLPLKRNTSGFANSGLDLNFYRVLMTQFCKANNINIIDPHYINKLNPNIPTYQTNFWHDTTHPNSEGSKFLADYIMGAILAHRSDISTINGKYNWSSSASYQPFTSASDDITIYNLQAEVSQNNFYVHMLLIMKNQTAGVTTAIGSLDSLFASQYTPTPPVAFQYTATNKLAIPVFMNANNRLDVAFPTGQPITGDIFLQMDLYLPGRVSNLTSWEVK